MRYFYSRILMCDVPSDMNNPDASIRGHSFLLAIAIPASSFCNIADTFCASTYMALFHSLNTRLRRQAKLDGVLN